MSIITRILLAHPPEDNNKGLTIPEVVVIVFIIGILILFSIALPSFVCQPNPSRESEAKQYVGAMSGDGSEVAD